MLTIIYFYFSWVFIQQCVCVCSCVGAYICIDVCRCMQPCQVSSSVTLPCSPEKDFITNLELAVAQQFGYRHMWLYLAAYLCWETNLGPQACKYSCWVSQPFLATCFPSLSISFTPQPLLFQKTPHFFFHFFFNMGDCESLPWVRGLCFFSSFAALH